MRQRLTPIWLLPLILLAVAIGPATAGAGAKEQPPVSAVVVNVHDGDTLTVRVPEWPEIIRVMPVRLPGLDAPELADPRPDIQALAILARDWLRSRLPKGTIVTLSRFGKEKYFRLLCHVGAEIDGETRDVGEELLRRGLARPYTGRNPKPW